MDSMTAPSNARAESSDSCGIWREFALFFKQPSVAFWLVILKALLLRLALFFLAHTHLLFTIDPTHATNRSDYLVPVI